MKRCPQCNSLYEDKIQFCLNDGQPLVNEGFLLPSEDDDEDTIIRHEPITVNFAEPVETPQVIYQTVPVEVENGSKNRNQLLYLLIGLLAGGGLVLAAVFITMNFSRNRETAANKPALNVANIQTPKPVISPANQNTVVALNIHEKPNPTASEDELNGRVISQNAYIRSAPNGDASIIETIPIDDRLNISRRAAPNSPWYQVTCEHGTKGWMHGNNIKFTKDNF